MRFYASPDAGDEGRLAVPLASSYWIAVRDGRGSIVGIGCGQHVASDEDIHQR